tara:strand:+ start:1467 stop:2045 length:579 start_codon:yes stop_codon:yes gene_type:complete
MENKTLSRALFFVSVLLFIITAYFVWGMMSNGAPDSYDPDQMGVELIDQGLATNANYAEEGKKAYENKISQIEGNILAGVNYMTLILFLAGGLMVVFLLWGLIKTLRTDFKKGIPSLIFVGIVILALIWASLNSGSDTEGFGKLVRSIGEEGAADAVSKSNFWVNGLLFVLIPGALILLVDLVWGLVKGYSK